MPIITCPCIPKCLGRWGTLCPTGQLVFTYDSRRKLHLQDDDDAQRKRKRLSDTSVKNKRDDDDPTMNNNHSDYSENDTRGKKKRPNDFRSNTRDGIGTMKNRNADYSGDDTCGKKKSPNEKDGILTVKNQDSDFSDDDLPIKIIKNVNGRSKEKDRLRWMDVRKNMTPIQKEKYNLMAKNRMRKYRQRLRIESKSQQN